MQNDSFSSVNGELRRSTMESMQFPYLDQQSLSPLFLPATGGDLFYSYAPSPFSPSSLSQSTMSTIGEDDRLDPTSSEKQLYLARLALQYQDINDRYDMCISHLQEAAEEAEALRQENARLRMANGDLSKKLAMISKSPVNLLADEFDRLGISAEAAAEASPTSVLPLQPINENQLLVHAAERRAVLPKSISIRSSGYLKKNNQTGPTGPDVKGQPGLRGTSPVRSSSQQQKVLLGVGSKKPEKPTETDQKELEQESSSAAALEVEVYNQGMFKTELCNKWEEMGECPYKDHCQFAHGISELRPVLRHPRYKTELCRMVLTGDKCPYGHRCHFRHSVSPSDRLLLRPS
ncbi:hypothetical protein LUZ60_000712 [Juncus effusus]|nr:hypothetical protein LUZ60_000712 [Juncus effusus]